MRGCGGRIDRKMGRGKIGDMAGNVNGETMRGGRNRWRETGGGRQLTFSEGNWAQQSVSNSIEMAADSKLAN